MTVSLDRYRTSGHKRVEGWLLQGAIEAMCVLAARQRELRIDGPICEIGVHHGRLFILLHLLSAGVERSLAIDLFEKQDENVDRSGAGSRDHLLRNLEIHGCDLARVDLLAANSLGLTAASIIDSCAGRPRLFSIDGGHTAEATFNDLALAHETTCDGGLVILDDYFNAAWPAVSEGTCAFMQSRNAVLVPVAITSNKFFFAKGESAAAAYREALGRTRPEAKLSPIFGHDVLTFEAPTPRQRIRGELRDMIAASPSWQQFRETPIGQALRRRLKPWIDG